ncbi:MAG: hypothetical protein ACTSPO_16050, partial [Candidatus Heimdallarchaeaceae archaeon]
YHIQKLKKLGLIEREQSYPFAIYKVTSLGERVKESIIHSDGLKNLWKCHSLIVGFEVQSFGTFRFINTNKRKIIQMKNWIYAMEDKGSFKIHIQDSGLLKIYCPEKYSTKPDEAFGKMYAESQSIAQRYCDRYKMELKQLKIIRKGHKALIGSKKVAKLLGKVNLDNKLWVDASDGTDELEEMQDEYSIEDILKIPKRMDGVEKAIIEQSKVNRELSRNIRLHLSIMRKMEKSQDIQNNRLEELGTAIRTLTSKIKELKL